jgi:hypothetical protein
MPCHEEQLLEFSDEEIAAERSAQTARRWYKAIQYAFEQVCCASNESLHIIGVTLYV